MSMMTSAEALWPRRSKRACLRGKTNHQVSKLGDNREEIMTRDGGDAERSDEEWGT
jgi:hypothetical protein